MQTSFYFTRSNRERGRFSAWVQQKHRLSVLECWLWSDPVCAVLGVLNMTNDAMMLEAGFYGFALGRSSTACSSVLRLLSYRLHACPHPNEWGFQVEEHRQRAGLDSLTHVTTMLQEAPWRCHCTGYEHASHQTPR